MTNKNQISAKDFRKKIASGTFSHIRGSRIKSTEPEDHDEVETKKSKKKLGRPNINETLEKLSKIEEGEFKKEDYIFIPGQVFSSKNSQMIRIKFLKNNYQSKWKCKINGRYVSVLPYISKSFRAVLYMKTTRLHYKSFAKIFKQTYEGKSFPLEVEFVFAMKTRRFWDWNNMTQLVQDCMVEGGWLPDDSVEYMLPKSPNFPKLAWFVSQSNPGVYIRVL